MSKNANRSFFAHPMGKFGLLILVLFGLWFGGWYAFANFADGKIAEALNGAGDRGVNVECTNRAIRGFPFRIGVHCDALNVAHKRDIYRMETGAIRTAAQLYAPGELIVEIDGPFKTWPNGRELLADWSSMRMFLDANFSGGFEIASLNFADLTSSIGTIAMQVVKGAVHFRPTPQPDSQQQSPKSLDGALTLNGFSADLPRLTIPEASLEVDGTLVEGYADLIVRRRPFRQVMKDGAAFEIRNLALVMPDGGRLAFSGPLEIDADGLVSGQINVGVNNPESVAEWAGKINHRLKQQVGMVGQAVAGMGKAQDFGGQELRSITLTIKRGQVSLGFIQLPDRIPPLFRD